MSLAAPEQALCASLDHVGAMVHDLAAVASRWERLGFTLTPVSRQRGKLPGRDDEGPWASANRCAVLQCGYLELIGLVDPAAYNPWTRFMSRFEGIHLVALRVDNADAAHRELASRHAPVHPTVQRERRVQSGERDEVMRFRNVFSRDDAHPEARYIVIEHQRADLLWQPAHLTHPNSAVGLAAATVVARDLPAQLDRLRILLATSPARESDGVARFALPGGGQIEIVTPDEFTARYDLDAPAEPAYAAIAVEFADPAGAVRAIEGAGIRVHHRSGRRWVAPDATGGFVMELRAGTAIRSRAFQ